MTASVQSVMRLRNSSSGRSASESSRRISLSSSVSITDDGHRFLPPQYQIMAHDLSLLQPPQFHDAHMTLTHTHAAQKPYVRRGGKDSRERLSADRESGEARPTSLFTPQLQPGHYFLCG